MGGGTLSTPTTTCGTTVTSLTPTTPSCTISGTYTPNSVTPVSQTVTGTLTFAGASGSPQAPYTSTQMSQPTGLIVGSLVSPNEFPPLMVAGTYTLQFLFTNTTGTAVPIGDRTFSCSTTDGALCTFTAGSGAGDDNCFYNLNRNGLGPHASCQLLGTVVVNALTVGNSSNQYTVTASLPFTGTGTPATVSTVGTEVATLPTSRTVTVNNKCSFPVWFSFNGAAVAGYTPPSCPTGTSAGSGSSAAICFWNNPTPNGGTYQLAATNGQAIVVLNGPSYGGVQWSGNISASTVCSGSSCLQADCGNFVNGVAGSCLVGQGFSQPATQAEITMNTNTGDSYDVEVINGFHIPISMKPVYDTNPVVPAVWSNYSCGTAGELTAQEGFGACNWSAAPPTVQVPSPTGGTGLSSGYYWVEPNGTSCDITSATDQCSTTTSGQLCGLSINRSNNVLTPNCGLFLGYWSADQVCSYSGLSSTVSDFFHCTQPLPNAPTVPSFPTTSTLYDLMRCKVPTGDSNPLYNSCYLTYSGYSQDEIETCCGCADWWNVDIPGTGTTIGSNSTAQSCGTQIDPQWHQYVQPMVQWMKAACPSVYTFPFDDKTSTFGCTNNSAGAANTVGYTITFCEGENTGLPSAITNPLHDGRIPTT